MEEVSLISLLASPFAMGVKIALTEKGIPFVAHEENNFPVKSELLLKNNPVMKQVPVLLHRGKPVCDSVVIFEYMEEALSGASLLPSLEDPLARAEARFWVRYGNSKFWETALNMLRKQGEEAVTAKEGTIACYMTLEEEWSKLPRGKPFFYGEKLGLPDIVLAPLVSWKPALEALGGFKFPGPDECPHMSAWMEAIEQHPSVKVSITNPNQVLTSVLGLKKMLDSMTKT